MNCGSQNELENSSPRGGEAIETFATANNLPAYFRGSVSSYGHRAVWAAVALCSHSHRAGPGTVKRSVTPQISCRVRVIDSAWKYGIRGVPGRQPERDIDVADDIGALTCRVSAINMQDCSGDAAGGFRHEKSDRIGDFSWLIQSSDRCATNPFVEGVRRLGLQ